MHRIFSLKNVFYWFFKSYFIFILVSFCFNHIESRAASFIVLLFSSSIALAIMDRNIRDFFNIKFRSIAYLAFFTKIFVGYLFWEFYFFPDYFTNEFSKMDFSYFEYLITLDKMTEIATMRELNGFFKPLPPEYYLPKHSVIHYFMSNFFYGVEKYSFNISVQNAFFSILSAYLILIITRLCGEKKESNLKLAFTLAAFQPFSLISSTIFRDIVGQFFVIFGFLIIFYIILRNFSSARFPNTILKKVPLNIFIIIILFTFSSFFFQMQRSAYVFFPILIYIYFLFFMKSNHSLNKTLPLAMLLLGIIVLELSLSISNKIHIFTTLTNNPYINNFLNFNILKTILFFPIKIFRVLLGPFPWTQFFSFNDYTIFQFSDYLQGTINLTFWIIIITNFRDIKGNKLFLILLFTTSLFLLSGLVTTDIHSTYVSIGTIFLVPIIVQYCNAKQMLGYVISMFYLLVFLNILYVFSGLTSTGIGSNFIK